MRQHHSKVPVPLCYLLIAVIEKLITYESHQKKTFMLGSTILYLKTLFALDLLELPSSTSKKRPKYQK
jgi:hypothetical protein